MQLRKKKKNQTPKQTYSTKLRILTTDTLWINTAIRLRYMCVWRTSNCSCELLLLAVSQCKFFPISAFSCLLWVTQTPGWTILKPHKHSGHQNTFDDILIPSKVFTRLVLRLLLLTSGLVLHRQNFVWSRISNACAMSVLTGNLN